MAEQGLIALEPSANAKPFDAMVEAENASRDKNQCDLHPHEPQPIQWLVPGLDAFHRFGRCLDVDCLKPTIGVG
jgi:hypothetical protein